MSKLKQAALSYAEQGWPIFPARANKTPYTSNGVIDATTNPKQIEEWWDTWPNANIALNVGEAGLMVLDLDPGHSMEELEKNVGTIPKTELSATTPRGGQHLYFRIGEGEIAAPSASKLAQFVDVRSFHSYVLLAPSKTKDGHYQWESEGKPHYRTDELLRAANTGREKSGDRDRWLIEPDLPENVASAIKWLREDAKIAIEGQGGDNMAYATAAHLKSFGISDALAFDLMWEHWNNRCSPPWSFDEADHLQQKVENGYSYNTSPPGNVTPAYHVAKTTSLFTPVVTELERGTQTTSGRFRFVGRRGMSSIRPPEWLIDNFLPAESYAILFGAPGTFKTFIALDVALSIASGGVGLADGICWAGVMSAGPVLFAAGEGRADITKRVSAWEKKNAFENEVENFVLADPVPMVNEELIPFIEGAKKECPSPEGKYKLVVLDTVGRAMQGMNENAQQDAALFTNMVEHIQYELDAAVLALHHTGFTDQHRARGSSVFGADADTIVRLERMSKANVVTMTMTKQKDSQEWARKKYVRLEKVVLTMEPPVDSLVARAGNEEAKAEALEHNKKELGAEILTDKVSTAVLDHLQGMPGKILSDNALATAVNTYDGITCGEQQLRKKYLPAIRRDNENPAHRLYDKDTNRWGWVPETGNSKGVPETTTKK